MSRGLASARVHGGSPLRPRPWGRGSACLRCVCILLKACPSEGLRRMLLETSPLGAWICSPAWCLQHRCNSSFEKRRVGNIVRLIFEERMLSSAFPSMLSSSSSSSSSCSSSPSCFSCSFSSSRSRGSAHPLHILRSVWHCLGD